ncbi:MAG: AI-2E family transporter [Pontiellaceae bacterium]|nr:AI-2E family transporter [Pontiellaceae bacterium]MBN2786593.1 AI-2E family transporter [Pontiellaceae bacterium]
MMNNSVELGPRQKATTAAAITLGAALVVIFFAFALTWGLARFAGVFKDVLLPPVVAGILAMLVRPYYDWLLKVCRRKAAGALSIFFLTALVPLALLLWLAGTFVANQLILLIDELPSMVNAMQEAARTNWPQIMALLEKYGVSAGLEGFIQDPGQMASNAAQAAIEQIAQSILHMSQSVSSLLAWAVLPVYLAFFLMAKPFEPQQIGEFLPFLKENTRKDVVYLFEQFVAILLTFFRGQIIIALIQGVLFAIGFALVGLPYGLMIGMLLGILNIIPYLGSIAGLAVAIPLAYFGDDGGVLRIVLVLVVFSAVQAIEGYVLTPRIMGERTGLHPAIIIFAVFFWGTALGGVLGMMLAIPLTAFAVVFWRLLKKKYIREVL